MPQHATTVTEYCAAVVRSRLIPEADVRDLHQRWKAEGKGADADVDLFRKFLVAKRCLTEYQAAELDRDVVAATIESTTRAGYYPEAAPIKVKVVADRRDGRIVGAQIVGAEGAAKRIDVIATAIWNHMPVDEVASLDLSYAPPFSPVWDPVLVAARKAADMLD